jgi:hypothetical protein
MCAAPASPSFTVTFNPSPQPPATSQFTFTNTDDGSVVDSYVVVDAGTTIAVTLVGATFASVPLIWSMQPSDGAPVVVMSGDLQTISFPVPAPSHYFHPWVFRLSVDTPGAAGIRSPNIYLTSSQPANVGINYQLVYSTASGSFSFLDSSSGSGQAGLVLDAELVWVNTIVPYRNFAIEVTTDDKSPVQFSNLGAIRLSAPTDPVWFTWIGDQPTVLLASINENAAGQSVSLRFQIEYNGINILSPDPILINSTIGDG